MGFKMRTVGERNSVCNFALIISRYESLCITLVYSSLLALAEN